ncbi:MAG: ATP-binding cassette domain-containing protein [Lachnospiraceae bacterium]
MSRKKLRNTVLTVVLWAALWQAAAVWIDNRIFLPSPLDVLQSLGTLLSSPEFFHSVGFSLGNIAKGFLLGVGIGTILAALASWSEFLCTFLSLPMRVIKATPVASFTILALLWIDSRRLSVLISFLMVLPIIYTNVLTGIRETDAGLLEMARVFRIRKSLRVRYLYAPAVLPYLFSACSVAIGLAWKSGIAAEVIGITKNSIGNHLYQAKIYLEIPELFAWTAVTIFISMLFEIVILRLLRMLEHVLLGQKKKAAEETQNSMAEQAEPADCPIKEEQKAVVVQETSMVVPVNAAEETDIVLSDITKAYGEHTVLQNLSLTLSAGHPVALMGSSGIGKTTLLRLVLGTESPEAGSIERGKNVTNFSVVFQENRLCEETSVRRNLELVCRTKKQREEIPTLLARLGLAACESKRVSNLSGGMKRRVAIGRALLADAQVFLFDEPFQGLDPATKLAVMRLVKERIQGKTVLFVTHEKSEAMFFDCQITEL